MLVFKSTRFLIFSLLTKRAILVPDSQTSAIGFASIFNFWQFRRTRIYPILGDTKLRASMINISAQRFWLFLLINKRNYEFNCTSLFSLLPLEVWNRHGIAWEYGPRQMKATERRDGTKASSQPRASVTLDIEASSGKDQANRTGATLLSLEKIVSFHLYPSFHSTGNTKEGSNGSRLGPWAILHEFG